MHRLPGGARRWALLLAVLLHDVPWKPWIVTKKTEGVREPLVIEALNSGRPSLEVDGRSVRADDVRAILVEVMRRAGYPGGQGLERNDQEALALIALLALELRLHGYPGAAEELASAAAGEWRGLIHEADVQASSLDRQLQPESLESKRFTNIFYPHWTRPLYPEGLKDAKNLLRSALPGFLERVHHIVDLVARSCRSQGNRDECVLKRLYQALYSLLEASWHHATLSKTMPAADTRIPNHTVFDHTRASAMATGLLGESLVALVDIPGIHSFISRARKTRDFWAGSWLISLLAWASVKPLVEALGPQVVLMPALHLNPFYLDLLASAMEGVEKLFPGIAWRDGWPSQPLMPATISLLLDPGDPGLKRLAEEMGCPSEAPCEALECIVRESLWRAWSGLWAGLRDRIREWRRRGCSLEAARGILGSEAPGDIYEAALRLVCLHAATAAPAGLVSGYFERLLDYLDAASREPPVEVRVHCAHVNYASKDYKGFVGKVVEELRRVKVRVGEGSNEVTGEELLRDYLSGRVRLEDALGKGLRLAYALAKLDEAVRSAPNSSPAAEAAIHGSVEALWETVKGEGLGARAYRYCSLCGRLPAVARMPRLGEDLGDLGVFDEGAFRSALRATGYLADEGESLCPYCLLRRMLARQPSIASTIAGTAGRAGRTPIESVLYIANKWSEAAEEIEKYDPKTDEGLFRRFAEAYLENLHRRGARLYRYIAVVHGDGDSIGSGYLRGVLVKPPEHLGPSEAEKLAREACAPAAKALSSSGLDPREYLPPLLYYSALYRAATGAGAGSPCSEQLARAVLANTILVASVSRVAAGRPGRPCIHRRGTEWEAGEEPCTPLTLVRSPSYMQALSAGLMATALADSLVVDALQGLLVYAGGDDVLAILPPAHEEGLDPLAELARLLGLHSPGGRAAAAPRRILEGWASIGGGPYSIPWLAAIATRLNYWGLLSGEPGFHVYRGIAAQAAAAHGRSYGVALLHYRTPLWEALALAERLMEAKDSFKLDAPGLEARYPGKDVFTIGYGAAPETAVPLPATQDSLAGALVSGSRGGLSPPARLVSMLYPEVASRRGLFTASLVYDALGSEGLMERLAEAGAPGVLAGLVEDLLWRNTTSTRRLKDWLSTHRQALGGAASTTVEAGGQQGPVLPRVFRALKYLLAASRR